MDVKFKFDYDIYQASILFFLPFMNDLKIDSFDESLNRLLSLLLEKGAHEIGRLIFHDAICDFDLGHRMFIVKNVNPATIRSRS